MRSRDEQQSAVDSSDYRELQLLTEIEKTPDVTQRELAGRSGIALGLTNILIRNLAQKGYLKVAHASWRRRLYSLTPEGFAHRIKLMAGYVHRVLNDYQNVRKALTDQLELLNLNNKSRVAIYGTGELSELVFLGLKEIGIESLDVYEASPAPGRHFLGLPIQDCSLLTPGEYDLIVVASLYDMELIVQRLKYLGATEDNLVTFFANGDVKKADD